MTSITCRGLTSKFFFMVMDGLRTYMARWSCYNNNNQSLFNMDFVFYIPSCCGFSFALTICLVFHSCVAVH